MKANEFELFNNLEEFSKVKCFSKFSFPKYLIEKWKFNYIK